VAAEAACSTVATGASNAIPGSLRHGCDITDRAWHDSYVPVVFLIAIAVVLVGIFFAATGRGGELAYEQADHAPLDLGPVSAADVALLRPPTAMWGYNMQVTDEALERISEAIRDRDVTIAFLQQRLADLSTPAAPVLPPSDSPLARPPQHARPADVGDPPGPGHPADPPGPDDRGQAQPGDSALAREEQTR
jgi:hypothetical protein